MATTYLTRTQGSPTENKKFTVSCWFQASQVADEMKLIYSDDNSTNNYTYIHFSDTSGRIRFQNRNGGSNNTELIWETEIKDFAAFYHLVMAVDSTQTTASDRVKFYLNGVQQTVLDSSANTFPPSDQTFTLNSGGYGVDIGANGFNNNAYFRGVMSYFAFIDGTQELPGIFGETDSTTGQWKIKTTITPSVAWGTNGFLILVNGNSVTDQSGQSNDFTVAAGTLTKTQDCPSNNFATMNPLDNYYAGSTFTNGNLSVSTLTSSDTFNNSTLGYATGKYYWETKNIRVSTNNYNLIGITSKGSTASNNYMMSSLYSVVLKQDGVLWQNAGSGSGAVSGWSGSSYTTGDIIGIAHDATNNKIYIHKNGVYMNSGNPSTGANGITTTASSLTDTGFWLAAVGDEISSGTSSQYTLNFGNGYFGTTAVTTNSGNGYAGAEGSSIFNYQPPTGYSALSTKGLNV